MKTFKATLPIFLLIIALFSSCTTAALYIGDTLTPTSDVDVFYAAKDVKHDYKVIGHISTPTSADENDAKALIVEKAKRVGSDGVIIIGMDFTGGKDSTPFYKAEAIKYTN